MNKFVECVGALVTRREKVLLVEHKLRGVELPSGHKNRGESDAQACKRECLEETGLEVLKVGAHVYTMYRGDVECKIFACETLPDTPETDGLSDVLRAWFGFPSELKDTASHELYPVVVAAMKAKHAAVIDSIKKEFPGLNHFIVGSSNVDLVIDGKSLSMNDMVSGSRQKDVLYNAFELPVGRYES